MKHKAISIKLRKKPSIVISAIPGHFTTSSFHLNYYLDLDALKTSSSLAREVAVELALPYSLTTLVDTIVCMEGTEVIGAYLANELLKDGISVINGGRDIHVVTPLNNVNRQLIFQNNVQDLIDNKNVLLLVASISSGSTVKSAMECLSYYNGKLVGISALFNAFPEKFEKKFGQKINYLFSGVNVINYNAFLPNECEMCQKGRKLDAIIMSGGYIRM